MDGHSLQSRDSGLHTLLQRCKVISIFFSIFGEILSFHVYLLRYSDITMTLQAKGFKLTDFLSSDEVFHIARVNITSTRDLNYHTHDYAEILWVESGNGTHIINGNRIQIKAGDVVMIRPSDKHTFSARGKGLTIINLAFSAKTLGFLMDRYKEETGTFFNPDSKMPYSCSMPQHIISRLSNMAEATFQLTKSCLLQDSLILTIFRTLYTSIEKQENYDLPVWLKNALYDYSSKSQFSDGVEEFARSCGRNPDYITRILKKNTGLTLTQTLQKIRMRYAATQLSLTTMPIKEIAQNCGYANLGHFYKVFNQLMGCSPKHYRTSTQQIV